MSGISLNTFIDRAKLSEGGDMRVSRDGGELVNKGTFGQKVATFFTDIGKALGLVKETKGNEAADRQEKALTGFREALVQQFGKSVADEALGQYKGDFNGKFVLDTHTRASQQAVEVSRHNAEILYTDQFKSALATLGMKSEDLTPQQRSDFGDHLETLKDKALAGDPHKLEGKELAGIAADALRGALGMPSARDEPALNAIKEQSGEMKRILEGNYRANGGKQFESVWNAVDKQLQKAATTILDGPRTPSRERGVDGFGAMRADQMKAMEKALNDKAGALLDGGAKDKILQQFDEGLTGMIRYHRRTEET